MHTINSATSTEKHIPLTLLETRVDALQGHISWIHSLKLEYIQGCSKDKLINTWWKCIEEAMWKKKYFVTCQNKGKYLVSFMFLSMWNKNTNLAVTQASTSSSPYIFPLIWISLFLSLSFSPPSIWIHVKSNFIINSLSNSVEEVSFCARLFYL